MNTQPEQIFKPNANAIALHLKRLFGDVPEGYEDGVIEISNLYESRFFNVTDLKNAVDCAVEWNTKGDSIYTTGSVLLPNTQELIDERRKADEEKGEAGKKYRALGSYFYYSNVTWIDVDKIQNNEDFRKQYQHCQPNYYVITSVVVEKGVELTSVHFWWLLDKPCFDKKELEGVNKGIIQNIEGGDKGTHNCTRQMKIGGTIAWPKKAGRVTQMVRNKDTGWMPTHAIVDLQNAYPRTDNFPVKQPSTLNLNDNAPNLNIGNTSFTQDDVLDMLKVITPDNTYFDWFSVGAALHDGGMPFEMWDTWSSSGAKYDGTQHLFKKWNSFSKGGGISLGTLYYHAKNAGFEFEKSSNLTPRTVTIEKSTTPHDPETGEIIEGEVIEGEDVEQVTLTAGEVINWANNHALDEIDDLIKAVSKSDKITQSKCVKIIKEKHGIDKADVKKMIVETINDEQETIAFTGTIDLFNKEWNNGNHLLFVGDKNFFEYNGKFWEETEATSVKKRILDKREYLHEKHGLKMRNALADEMLSTIKAQASGKLNTDIKPIINVQNGELWIEDDALKPHCHSSHLLNCLNTDYDKESLCPLFEKSLFEIFANERDPQGMVDYMFELIGYLIQPNKNIRGFWIFHGEQGNNGKSLISYVIQALLGDAYLGVSIKTLDSEKHPHAHAQLHGRLVVVDDDLEKGVRLPGGILKKLSHNTMLTANPKHKASYNFKCTATPLILCNHLPYLSEMGGSIESRCNVVPFSRVFKNHEVNRNLDRQIIDNELGGVLNSALKGLARLRKRGYFEPPQPVVDATQSYLEQSNVFSQFINANYKKISVESGYETKIDRGLVYNKYKEWCDENGTRNTLSRENFYADARTYGLIEKSTGGRNMVYTNIQSI